MQRTKKAKTTLRKNKKFEESHYLTSRFIISYSNQYSSAKINRLTEEQ